MQQPPEGGQFRPPYTTQYPPSQSGYSEQYPQQQQPVYPPPPYQQQPTYQQYQTPPMQQNIFVAPSTPKKSRAWLWITLGIVGLLALCSCVGVYSTHLNNGTTQTGSSQHFQVGDVVKVGDAWQITVQKPTTSNGGTFAPDQGKLYLEIPVMLKNISSQEQSTSSLVSWTLRDDTGQSYTESVTSGASSPPDGKVESNSQISGTLAYEVPTGKHQFTLDFQSNIVASGETVWDLSV